MADAFSWSDIGRWLVSLRRVLPDRILRWFWSDTKLLAQIQVRTVAEPPPHFFVRLDREHPELSHLGFHVFNFSPFNLSIIAVSGSVSLDSRELFVHEHRFAAEISLAPSSSAVFHIRHTLTEPQAERLRRAPHVSARVRMQGGMYLKTPFGERRVPIGCDLDARVDR